MSVVAQGIAHKDSRGHTYVRFNVQEVHVATPYDSAITALEEEITALTAALQVLRRRSQEDTHKPNGTRLSFNPDFANVKAYNEPTNEEAVEAILEAAYPEYLGTSRIVELGPGLGGRNLNKNSVRWVLKHGVDAMRIEKMKQNGRASYRIVK